MCRMVPNKNGRNVADIKLRHIDNISAQAEKCRNITRIVLFGSSLEARCTNRSDIDIAVFGNQTKAKYLQSKEFKEFHRQLFLFDMDQDYDILYFTDGKTNTDQIMNDIAEGIEIYRREPA